jgi:predicted amidohydrolase YtcJ
MLAAGRAAVKYMNSQGITGWLDAAASGAVGGVTRASIEDPGFLPVYAAIMPAARQPASRRLQ